MDNTLKDINGELIHVGDIMVRASGGNLVKCYLMGVTSNGFWSSCIRKGGTHNDTGTYVGWGNIKHHNSKQYISDKAWRDTLLIEKKPFVPKELIELFNCKQLNMNE